MDLIDIAKSWYNFTTKPEELVKVAKDRLTICDTCPNKMQMNPLGQALLNLTNQESSTYKCSLCGCPLAAKVFSDADCPAGKW